MKGGNKVLAQMSVNASTLSVFLHNITLSNTFSVGVRVVAYTRVGPGPYSPVVMFSQAVSGPDARPTGQAPQHTWFVLLFAASIIVFIVAFAITIYLKKRQSISKELGHLHGKYNIYHYKFYNIIHNHF